MLENQELGTWSTDLGPLEMVPDEKGVFLREALTCTAT